MEKVQQLNPDVVQYLTQQRIAEAQRRLIATEDSILDVALDSGFQSLSQFHEMFRKQTYTSPRRFRLSQREPLNPSVASGGHGTEMPRLSVRRPSQ